MKNFYVKDDGRVYVPKLDFGITSQCNLDCRLCSQLNPLRNYAGAPTQSLIFYLEKWAERLDFQTLLILGGEPLLRPDLPNIICRAREILPDTIIAGHYRW